MFVHSFLNIDVLVEIINYAVAKIIYKILFTIFFFLFTLFTTRNKNIVH